MFASVRAYWTLLRWLGPWANENKVPAVERREVAIEPQAPGDRPFCAWYYTPVDRRSFGAYLLTPGVHFAGPADPRLDRFARVLAASGMAVLAPFLPDFVGLRVAPAVFGDLDRAFGVLLEQPEVSRTGSRPGVFSISFGSLPALRLVSSETRAHQVGSLVVFGGYADWRSTMEFCLTGKIKGRLHTQHDPLNQPVVFMNLVDWIPGAPEDPTALLAAWRRYVEATWGRPWMKLQERYLPLAEEIAADVPEPMRELFLVGCRAKPGAEELCRGALGHGRWDLLDPRPHLSGLQCAVHLVHGLHDDVIPFTQMALLKQALPQPAKVRTYLTGLFGHTGKMRFVDVLRLFPAAAREAWTLMRMVWAVVGGARVSGQTQASSDPSKGA